MSNVAKSVREKKEKTPEYFCPKCLWRVISGFNGKVNPCQNHPGAFQAKFGMTEQEMSDKLFPKK